MKIHVIIDFMHIYYKYFFMLKQGKIKKLKSPINWKGTVIEKDTSLIYYSLRDIENIRKGLESYNHDATVSVCFDSPSIKKDDDSSDGYKSGRKKVLSDDDFENINYIRNVLSKAGHNTYKIDGYEADDIVNNLVKTYKDNFEYTIIYTNDKDLLINVCDKVGVMRFKQGKGYESVDINSYSTYLEKEFGVFIPYNAIGLYLSSVGDSSDNIKGISKFGKVAFKKLITKIASKNDIDWAMCNDNKYLESVVEMCKCELTDEQYNELYESFKLVSNLRYNGKLDEPINKSSLDLRDEAYGELNMKSLVE